MEKIRIVRVGDYYFCPKCADRLLVDKRAGSYLCIHCGFSALDGEMKREKK